MFCIAQVAGFFVKNTKALKMLRFNWLQYNH